MADPGLRAAAVALVADAATRDPWLRTLRLDGIGWATVELERAAEEIAAEFARAGLAEPAWSPGARDAHLGAMTWVSRDDLPALVLLEPDTEGRLAATLARFGEGVGAVYLSRHADGATVDVARLGAPGSGALGTGRLVLARPAWGPHVLVLDR